MRYRRSAASSDIGKRLKFHKDVPERLFAETRLLNRPSDSYRLWSQHLNIVFRSSLAESLPYTRTYVEQTDRRGIAGKNDATLARLDRLLFGAGEQKCLPAAAAAASVARGAGKKCDAAIHTSQLPTPGDQIITPPRASPSVR